MFENRETNNGLPPEIGANSLPSHSHFEENDFLTRDLPARSTVQSTADYSAEINLSHSQIRRIEESSSLENSRSNDCAHSLLNRIAFKTFHGSLDILVKASELVFTANPIGRTVCVLSAVGGWVIPQEVFTAYPSLGIGVAWAALTASVVSSSVNRAITYRPELLEHPDISEFASGEKKDCFKRSLQMAGMLAGPASFWSAISPVLTHARDFGRDAVYASSLPNWIGDTAHVAIGKVEFMVPFVMIYTLTSIGMVNKNPQRFVDTMGKTAAKLHKVFAPFARFSEWVGQEFKQS